MNKVDALGHEVLRYTRDPNGQVTNRWTPQFGNTGFAYDEVGNLKAINYSLSSISYAYDALNRLKTMVDDSGTSTFGYTAAGQLQSEQCPWANDTLTYGYTEGQRTSLSINNPLSTINYSYDSAWRLKSLISPAGVFGYGYGVTNPASALVRTLALPNAAWITNHYDSFARLDYTALENQWGHVLDGYGYTHDPLGLRTNIVRNLGLTTNVVAVGYDNIGQVTAWSAREASGTLRLNEQLGFGFDQAGNLRFRTNGGLVQTFTCDPVNELTNVARNNTMTVSGATPAPASSVTVNSQVAQTYGDFTFARTNVTLSNGNNSFTVVAHNAAGTNATDSLTVNLPSSGTLLYDSNGNLTNDGTRSFAYDAENRLAMNWVASAWKSEFVYDGLGRRRISRDYGWQGGQWVKTNETRYVYDGYLAIQERDSNNVARVTYTRGLDLSASLSGAGGIGGLLARTDGNGSTFYHADGAGNITGLMDGQQDMAARYLYGPFGRLVGMWGPMAGVNRMMFSSKEFDPRSGLYFYGSRFFDPTLQRWLSRDPIGERGDLNLYRGMFNSPLNVVDRDGGEKLSAGRGERDGGINLLNESAGGEPDTAINGASQRAGRSVQPGPTAQPVTYNALLLDKPGLVDTPVGYDLAHGYAVSIMTAPGAEMIVGGALSKVSSLLKAKCVPKAQIPKIMGHTPSLRDPELVGKIKADMLAGRYRFDSPEGIIAGFEDENGVIHLTEGQHRMNAALEYTRRLVMCLCQSTPG